MIRTPQALQLCGTPEILLVWLLLNSQSYLVAYKKNETKDLIFSPPHHCFNPRYDQVGIALTVAPQLDENSVAFRNSISEWEGQVMPPPQGCFVN